DAIEREFVARCSRRAVRDEIRTSVVIEGARELEVADITNAWREPRERERIAIRERQLRDAPPINHLTGRGRRGLKLRRVRSHSYRFRHGAYFERQVELQLIADAHLHALTHRLLEALCLDRHL